MTDHQSTQNDEDAPEQECMPDGFVEQVKQVLEHLYDLHYLQHHPLAQEGRQPTQSSVIAGQNLRRELAAAIEALNPGTDVSFRAPHARLYNLIRLHYAQGMTVQEAAHELGISLRQAYRDLRKGEKSVAGVIWARRSISSPQEPNATLLSSIQAEVARLETHPRSTDLHLLLQQAQEAVEVLAQQRGIYFRVEPPLNPVIVSADPVVARQVLISVLSRAVQQAQPGTLHMQMVAGEERSSLTLRYEVAPDAVSMPAVNLVVAQLADRLGWMVRQEDQPCDIRVVRLKVAAGGPTVLVIDDNEGLVTLLKRYLTDRSCRVVATANGQEGYQLAQELVPDAIVLDVMMPEIDGWELLQRLRTGQQTSTIPVIICSVINDPGLAYSLGASLFLPKPVSRDAILTALRKVGVM
jgi:CheY-like chemotaxis protein